MKFEVTRKVEEIHTRTQAAEVDADNEQEAILKASRLDEYEWEHRNIEFDKDLGTEIIYRVTEIEEEIEEEIWKR